LVHDTKTGKYVPTKRTQNVPNGHKISQMSVKYLKWPYYVYINIFQSMQGPPKFTQSGIFVLKRNHLATLFYATIVGT
jgi:hypothetical protein